MKKIAILVLVMVMSLSSIGQEQPWVTSLPIAKIMARAENKMILMIWDNAAKYPLPVLVRNSKGRAIVVDDLFASPALNEIIWNTFIPVVVGEASYADLFAEIEGKRKQTYIDKFNNDALKVMDANGNILGTSSMFVEIIDFSKFLAKYNLDTSYIQQELINYNTDKNFYSAFYLASKYIDYGMYVNTGVREEILELSDLYFDEAEVLINEENPEDKDDLLQRILLTKMKKDLIRNKPRKVLRQLKKLKDVTIEKVNQPLLNFIYYTAYRLQSDQDKFQPLEKEISLLNLKRAQRIVEINR